MDKKGKKFGEGEGAVDRYQKGGALRKNRRGIKNCSYKLRCYNLRVKMIQRKPGLGQNGTWLGGDNHDPYRLRPTTPSNCCRLYITPCVQGNPILADRYKNSGVEQRSLSQARRDRSPFRSVGPPGTPYVIYGLRLALCIPVDEETMYWP